MVAHVSQQHNTRGNAAGAGIAPSMTDDPRIVEIQQLAAETGLPLALRPETICALEDNGYIADPFTGMIWPDWAQEQTAPAATLLLLAELDAAADEVRHGRA